jgi:disulfide bond formation protein DsbB
MYPLVVIILVSIWRQNAYLGSYVLPFSITGALVAFYHVLIEWGIVPEGAACAGGVPCGLRYVNYLGFITIPFQSLIAFLLITVIIIGVWWAWQQE